MKEQIKNYNIEQNKGVKNPSVAETYEEVDVDMYNQKFDEDRSSSSMALNDVSSESQKRMTAVSVK